MEKTNHTGLTAVNCATCHFHQTITGPDKSMALVCRKNPPTMHTQLVPTANGPTWYNNVLWPLVGREDWCGAYEREKVDLAVSHERIDGEVSQRAS